MQAYTAFAQVYDIFMDNVPYDQWTDYLTELLQEHDVKDGLVLELGCGTGNITRRLAEKGYDMIGIDLSEDMLEIARENEYERLAEDYDEDDEEDYDEDNEEDYDENNEEYYEDSTAENSCVDSFEENEETEVYLNNKSILYLQQDMRDFELYGTVSAVVSVCDSMNYITSEEDLLKVFKLVNNYLDRSGIFIFDMNTEYKYKNILASNTIAENREDCSFIWENYYDADKMLNEYEVTIFAKIDDDNINKKSNNQPDSSQLFRRFQENHYQKAYSIETIIKLIEKAGMEFITVYDVLTHNPPTETTERVYFIAREQQQSGKKYI